MPTNPNQSLIDLLRDEQRNWDESLRMMRAKYGPNPTTEQQAAMDDVTRRRNSHRAHADYLEGKGAPGDPVYPEGVDLTGLSAGTPQTHVDGTKSYGIDSPGAVTLPQGDRPLVLTKDQKVATAYGTVEVPEDAVYGWIGCAMKSALLDGATDPREAEQYAKAFGPQHAKALATTGAASVLVPAPIAARVVDLMRSRLVTIALGAQTVPMRGKTESIPRLTGDVAAAWYAEGATIATSDPTLDSVLLQAERLESDIVKVSLELEQDADPVPIGRIVAQSIASALALKVDAAALRGSGVSPEPRGVRNQTGVTLHAVGANGDVLDYGLLLALARSVYAANATPTGFAMTPGAAVTLSGLREGGSTGPYLMPPPLLASLSPGSQVTTAIPSNLTKGTGTGLTEIFCGDFTQLLIGIREGLTISTLREVYRAEGRVGIVGRMRAGVAVEHGNAFAVATHVDD